MAWQDELDRLRAAMARDYSPLLAEFYERRDLLEKYAGNLGIDGLLGDMNAALLDGAGRVIVKRSWEYDFDDDAVADDEADEEIAYVLFWYDGTHVELEVRVGIDEDDSGYVLVQGDEVDDEPPEEIQDALLDAFRDIAEIDDDDDDEIDDDASDADDDDDD